MGSRRREAVYVMWWSMQICGYAVAAEDIPSCPEVDVTYVTFHDQCNLPSWRRNGRFIWSEAAKEREQEGAQGVMVESECGESHGRNATTKRGRSAGELVLRGERGREKVEQSVFKLKSTCARELEKFAIANLTIRKERRTANRGRQWCGEGGSQVMRRRKREQRLSSRSVRKRQGAWMKRRTPLPVQRTVRQEGEKKKCLHSSIRLSLDTCWSQERKRWRRCCRRCRRGGRRQKTGQGAALARHYQSANQRNRRAFRGQEAFCARQLQQEDQVTHGGLTEEAWGVG